MIIHFHLVGQITGGSGVLAPTVRVTLTEARLARVV
jgi:hypothetical protein